ncbi:MAG: ABC transporter permease, partial [Pseudomonadota bacterium]
MMSNRPMLAFPVVRLLDIVLGRAELEIVGALLTAVMVLGVLWAIGANPVPVDPMEATLAFIVVAAFSTGMGIAVSCVVMKLEFFATVWAVFSIVIYLLSGTIFTISYLPAELIDILSWNPLLHATEWMRSAFFIGYPSQVLDKTYLLGWTVGSIVLGLVCERVFRAGLLSS